MGASSTHDEEHQVRVYVSVEPRRPHDVVIVPV